MAVWRRWRLRREIYLATREDDDNDADVRDDDDEVDDDGNDGGDAGVGKAVGWRVARRDEE